MSAAVAATDGRDAWLEYDHPFIYNIDVIVTQMEENEPILRVMGPTLSHKCRAGDTNEQLTVANVLGGATILASSKYHHFI